MEYSLVPIGVHTMEALVPHSYECLFWESDSEILPDRCDSEHDVHQTFKGSKFDKETWISHVALDWGICGQSLVSHGRPQVSVLYSPSKFVPRANSFPSGPVGADAILLTSLAMNYSGSSTDGGSIFRVMGSILPGVIGKVAEGKTVDTSTMSSFDKDLFIRIALRERLRPCVLQVLEAALADLRGRGVRAVEAFALKEPKTLLSMSEYSEAKTDNNDNHQAGEGESEQEDIPAALWSHPCIPLVEELQAAGFRIIAPHRYLPRLRIELEEDSRWKVGVAAALDQLLQETRIEQILADQPVPINQLLPPDTRSVT